MINTLSQINVQSDEGRLLMAALAILTTQPQLTLFGKPKRGSSMTPDEMIEACNNLAIEMFKEETNTTNT